MKKIKYHQDTGYTIYFNESDCLFYVNSEKFESYKSAMSYCGAMYSSYQ